MKFGHDNAKLSDEEGSREKVEIDTAEQEEGEEEVGETNEEGGQGETCWQQDINLAGQATQTNIPAGQNNKPRFISERNPMRVQPDV